MARFDVYVSLVVLISSLAAAQSGPQAITYAAQSISALSGGTAISDITLNGSATRTVGADVESGPATYYGKGQYESRLNLNLSNGNRTEIRTATNGPQGEWIDSNGNANPYAQFNCLTDSVWFYPALTSLSFSGSTSQVLSYIGLETLNGESVQHLQSVWFGMSLTTTDFYLDAGTLLPVQMNFNGHPDTDASTNIPFQVVFSSYQNVGGALIPYHVQEYVNGNLLLDFTASSSVLNSGLPDTLFTLQ
jgi:hypothetical protein